MKLVVTYQNKNTSDKKLTSRDIRNYIGSLSSDGDKTKTMWHEREIPPIIYQRPSNDGFALISYINNDEMLGLFNRIKLAIEMNKKLSFKNGFTAEIDQVFISQDFKLHDEIVQGYDEKILRTPMLLKQHMRAKSLTDNGKILDIVEFEKMLIEEVKESIIYMQDGWTNNDVSEEIENAVIFAKNIKYYPIKISPDDTKYKPAVYCTLVSSVKLPKFVGYGVGLGYGELMIENKRRPLREKK